MAGQSQGEGAQFSGRDFDVIICSELRIDARDGARRQLIDLNPVSARVLVTAGRKAHAVRVAIAAKLLEPIEDRFVFVSVLPTVMADAGILGVFDFGAEVLKPLCPVARAFGLDDRVSAA